MTRAATAILLMMLACNSGCVLLFQDEYRYLPDPQQKEYQSIIAVDGASFTLADGRTYELAGVDFSHISPEEFRLVQHLFQTLVQKPPASGPASMMASSGPAESEPAASRLATTHTKTPNIIQVGYHQIRIYGDAPTFLVINQLAGRAQIVTGGGPEVKWPEFTPFERFPVLVLIPIVIDAPPTRCDIGLLLVEQGMAEPCYSDLSSSDRKLYAQALKEARKCGWGSWWYLREDYGGIGRALYSSSYDSPEKVKYLLEKAPDRPTREDIFKSIGYAIFYNKLDSLKLLIAHCGDINDCPPDYGNNVYTKPLIHASGETASWPIDRVKIAKMMLEHGAKVNLAQKNGITALHAAADVCDPELVKLLLAAGADPNAKTVAKGEGYDERAKNPLDFIRRSQEYPGYKETAKLLEAAMEKKP